MLVLSRKVGERIVIADTVVVQVLAVRRGQIRLGISAPASVSIRREELPRHDRPNGRETRAGLVETSDVLSEGSEGHAGAERHLAGTP
jgi:carbon storage regulator